jgi:cadmium resistance protein CadD (predicted permease)
VATVTFANGGDNIGVYVPVFATAGIGDMSVYVVVFLVLLAAWIAAGRFFATRPVIAKALSRCGHILLPVVLIGIGLLILIEGNAFGL